MQLDDYSDHKSWRARMNPEAEARSAEQRHFSLLADPAHSRRRFLVFSVDDHLVEPPDMFEGRLPREFADRAPRVVEDGDGGQAWLFEGQLNPNIGLAAVAGRPLEECAYDPERFEFMRPGAYDPAARLTDMDIDGVWASVCFPSALVGFGGQRLQQVVEPAFALALVRAINDWHLDTWVARCPQRFVPVQIPYLFDAVVAADEVRANAARGFKALTFPESPQRLGLPSIHSTYWDPLMKACEETETVVCLHVGSSAYCPPPSPDSPVDTISVLFGSYAQATAVDWLYSRIPVRFPHIRLAMSEGGISWVPGLIDRLQHVMRYQRIYGTWNGVPETLEEVFRRNFWHCALDDPTTMRIADAIGLDRIMVEVDYPHLDSDWPNTQINLVRALGELSADQIDMVTWANASTLFQLPVEAPAWEWLALAHNGRDQRI